MGLVKDRKIDLNEAQLEREIVGCLSSGDHIYLNSLAFILKKCPSISKSTAISSALMNYLFTNKKLESCYEWNIVELICLFGFQRNKQIESIVMETNR